MKTTLTIAIDSAKPDMGVSDLIEEYRELFERENGRQKIADTMTFLMQKRNRVNRQMVEKWFRKADRTLPSSALLVTLLWACKLLRDEHRQYVVENRRRFQIDRIQRKKKKEEAA